MTGIVLRAQGGIYQIETSEGVLDAVLRGKVKREERLGDRVVVGDKVEVEPSGEEEGAVWTIESVHERASVLARRAPGKAPRAKVIVANVDQVMIVFAVAHPEPHLRMLDRFLVICESTGLEAVIVANKVDLTGMQRASEIFSPYEKIGYPVIYTSPKQDLGIELLEERLRGRISALTGPSGVGKSSLLNAVQPGLALRVASVSDAVQKGQHTTVTAQLVPLEFGGYVADTPGLRELGLWGIPEDELDQCFPEFEPYLGECRYTRSCTHTHEPGCAVRKAVDAGAVTATRYESYRRMREGEDEPDAGW
jgi:ribosome biogenesis GTPase